MTRLLAFHVDTVVLLLGQAIREIYAEDAAKNKAAVTERKKNSTIEMSAARIAAMMEESGGGEAGGDVPMVKVRIYSIYIVATVLTNSSSFLQDIHSSGYTFSRIFNSSFRFSIFSLNVATSYHIPPYLTISHHTSSGISTWILMSII